MKKDPLVYIDDIRDSIEAANRLPDEFRSQYNRIPWNKIIGMRNVLIHEYDSIDLDRVWETIQKDIPELEGYIKSIPS